jgi:4-hydroxy-3-polyprenylbenzoate decarboxylase
MRKSPIFPATIVGRPPMEDFYLGHATERIFLPLLKLTIPEIVDYHMPAEGIFTISFSYRSRRNIRVRHTR